MPKPKSTLTVTDADAGFYVAKWDKPTYEQICIRRIKFIILQLKH